MAACDDHTVLRTIVEGEPGIFPDPVARIMRGIGGIFRRRGPADEPPFPGPRTGGDETTAADAPPDAAESPAAHDHGSIDEPTTSDEPDQPRGHPGETR